MTLRVLSLFAGIGGFDLGLERTGGFKTVAFCEFDKKAQLVLAKHWPGVPIYDDVRTLTGSQLLADAIAVDCIVGGFPCQDISVAGAGAGIEGERSGLWVHYARLIGEIRPAHVIVENVSALLGRGLGRVLGDMAALGYDADWHCIPASHVGAPHRRDRVWIMAYPMRNGHIGQGCSKATAHHEERDAEASERPRTTVSSQAQSSGKVLAHPPLMQRNGVNDNARECLGGQPLSESGNDGRSGNVADADSTQRQGNERSFGIVAQYADPSCASWWGAEPDVGRVAHGVPKRVDRLKQLGNAVVPQIPELIGRAILASEAAA